MRALVLLTAAMAASLGFAAPAKAAVAARGPDALPAMVVGVLGSGDQLSLEIRPDEIGRRALRVGDPFEDGWVLGALTPSTATLTRDGQSRTVGLNPTGALARSEEKRQTLVQVSGSELPPEVIEVLAMTDEEVIAKAPGAQQRLAAAHMPGLTAEETRRYIMMELRSNLYYAPVNKAMQYSIAAAKASGIDARPALISERYMLPVFGQDYADLWYKHNAAMMADWQTHTDAARAAGQPEFVRVPTGVPGHLDDLAYIQVERDAAGAVYQLYDQPALRSLDQVYPGSEPNVRQLTPQMLQSLVGSDGAPVDAATQAAILAQNAQDRATEAAKLAAINDPSIQYYGLFGPVARR